MIPQSRPHLAEEDFAFLPDLIRSRQVAAGALVAELEGEFCKYLGVRHAMATSHGTAALHLALLALGVGPGDEVIIPSYTCVAVLHAVHYVGARPVLTDIDPATFNPTPEMLRARASSRTKAVVITHTFGFPADLEPIIALGIPVIEDCATALGALYGGCPVGSWGRVSIFSFYATKMLCSGEGGMVCTDDSRLARRLRDLNRPDQRADYRLRYNYKMSDLTGGLALSQFRKLDSFVERRRQLAERYQQTIEGSGLRTQQAIPGSQPAYYRFVALAPRPAEFMRRALLYGIVCDRPVYRPLHRYMAKRQDTTLRNTDAVWRSGISVPMYPDLNEEEVAQILAFLGEAAHRPSDMPSACQTHLSPTATRGALGEKEA